jgi:tRNA pseudouridine38-40 synthase
MVRSIVGGLKAVGEGKATRADIRAALDAKKRAGAYKVQPAHGLTLIEIGYPAESELANQASITKNTRSIDEN